MSAEAVSQADILSRAIAPCDGNWSTDAATSILQIELPAADVDRLNILSEKAGLGELSVEEQEEVGNYRHVGRMLKMLKAKTRTSLKSC
jgi:hypothetical protein